MVLRAFLALALVTGSPAAARQPESDGVAGLVGQLEAAGAAGDFEAIRALGVTPDAPGLRAFATGLTPAPTRFLIKERDRAPRDGGGERLLLEVFAEFGNEALITSWRAEVVPDALSPSWRIAGLERLTFVSGLYRLALNPRTQFRIRNLTVRAPDLTLDIPSGWAFVAEASEGPTAVVLLGRGRMRFAPENPAERTQLNLFAGDDVLTSEFDAAFIRVRPSDFASVFSESSLVPTAVRQGDFRRAREVFDEYIGQTLQLDLSDLSRDRWSLLPMSGDLIAEVRTRRHGHLTYARSWQEAEDITLFDRRRRRNISIYASDEKLASRGPFYSEDDLLDYDILHYDIDAAIAPDRLWIDGTARIRLQAQTSLSSLTLRLADSLTVRSVVSPELGRLLNLRVVGQNAVVVNLPTIVGAGAELTVQVVYGGRLEPQQIAGEGIGVEAHQDTTYREIVIPIEPHFIYSNRSYWYPQSTVSDYATSRLRIAVPAGMGVIATGTSAGPAVAAPATPTHGRNPATLFEFASELPARYLSCVISRFSDVLTATVPFNGSEPAPAGAVQMTAQGSGGTAESGSAGAPDQDALTLTIVANPRQSSRGESAGALAASMIRFYQTLIGDPPYPAFTLALTEDELPGGHSPAYFAVLNQPLPLMPFVWRNDPVAFDDYPPYFLAHEIAHQWWGQAVGWKNYHEQWLSEGFAQYFAVLYAGRERGPDLFTSMLRQMGRWAVDRSSQGPVYLGYRLGHIKDDSRVFRALVYNKGAMVLHMLRRLIGQDAFFAGIRAFYSKWKFQKAGTHDLRAVMEEASGQDLRPFFDAWIYGSAIPHLRFGASAAGDRATLRLEHLGEVIPTPVTVTITYADGTVDDIVVPVTTREVLRTVPLRGSVRSIDVNRDHAVVAEFSR